jgi:hypothetical protein
MIIRMLLCLLAISVRNRCEVAFGHADYLECSMLLGTFSGTSMFYVDSLYCLMWVRRFFVLFDVGMEILRAV